MQTVSHPPVVKLQLTHRDCLRNTMDKIAEAGSGTRMLPCRPPGQCRGLNHDGGYDEWCNKPLAERELYCTEHDHEGHTCIIIMHDSKFCDSYLPPERAVSVTIKTHQPAPYCDIHKQMLRSWRAQDDEHLLPMKQEVEAANIWLDVGCAGLGCTVDPSSADVSYGPCCVCLEGKLASASGCDTIMAFFCRHRIHRSCLSELLRSKTSQDVRVH